MTFLHDIIEKKKPEILELYEDKGIHFFKEALDLEGLSPANFKTALGSQKLSLIAEIKKASPSKGIIREDFDPVDLMEDFETHGAAALSVLTEQHYFKGHPNFIPLLKAQGIVPILRKDFIIDPIQVFESKYLGADAILLIKAILSTDQIKLLTETADALELDVLLEIHSEEELDQIADLPLDLIGINNRDLTTFETDKALASSLYEKVKATFPDAQIVAESGYNTPQDLAELEEQGFTAVLIGEGLAKNPDLLHYFG